MEGPNEELKTTQPAEIAKTEKTPKTTAQSIWELVRFALIAIIIVVPIRLFIAQPFIVSGSSMFPTFENGQYLIVNEISYELGSPHRDDVVVFKYPKDTTKYFIKRVVGLPGETVDIKGSTVTITNKEHPKGLVLEQPFVKNQSDNATHLVLGDGEYFVMGDNRSGSSDSRVWGPVPQNLFIGKVFVRLLPIKNISFFPGYYTQAE